MKKTTGSKATPARQEWRHTKEAQAFHRKHGHKAYTMTWNDTVEAEMMDEALPKEARVLAAIRRYSWGMLSDFAVDAMPQKKPTDPKPETLSQLRLGKILGLNKSSMNEACIYLKDRGYLRKDHPFLFPEDHVSLLDSTEGLGVDPNSTESRSPYLRFEKVYLGEHPEARTTITNLRDERKKFQVEAKLRTDAINELKRVILNAFKEEQRKTKDLTPEEKEEGEPMRLYARAQNEGEHKAKRGASYSLESDPNSKTKTSATPEWTIRPVADQENANPPDSLISSPRPFKDNLFKGTFGSVEGGTTTIGGVESASVVTPPPTESLSEEPDRLFAPDGPWHQNLCRAFRATGKGSPTRNQSADAYRAAAPHWDEFLRWLAIAPAFAETKHPGGLPALIQMFLADRTAESVTAPAAEPRPRKRKQSVSEKLSGWVKGEKAS